MMKSKSSVILTTTDCQYVGPARLPGLGHGGFTTYMGMNTPRTLRSFIANELGEGLEIVVQNEEGELLVKGTKFSKSISQRMSILGRSITYAYKVQNDGSLLIVVGNN